MRELYCPWCKAEHREDFHDKHHLPPSGWALFDKDIDLPSGWTVSLMRAPDGRVYYLAVPVIEPP